MLDFLEVTKKESNRRVLISVSTIRSVIELTDGAFIETDSGNKKDMFGFDVADSYESIVQALCFDCVN